MAQKRRHKRYSMIEMVTVVNADTEFSVRGCLEDISIGGASFITPGSLAGWKNIKVELPGINVAAQIVRSEKSGGNWIFRVKFEEMGFFRKIKLRSVIKKTMRSSPAG